MQGGYWHEATKYFEDENLRDRTLMEALTEIKNNNGTTLRSDSGAQQGTGSDGKPALLHWMKVIYVIEEPNHFPYKKFAATIDRIGVDPDFVHPYDGVAEQGPDYTTPREQQLSYVAALSGRFDDITPIPSAIPTDPSRRTRSGETGRYPY